MSKFYWTVSLGSSLLCLWLDGERGSDGYEENPLLRPLLPYVQISGFNAQIEAADKGGKATF